MPILRRRPKGEKTKIFQARISEEAYDRLEAYSYATKQSFSLALDDIIFKNLGSCDESDFVGAGLRKA